MKPVIAVAAAFLCAFPPGARAEDIPDAFRRLSQSIRETKKTLARVRAEDAARIPSPMDALDDSKTGLSAKFVTVDAGDFQMGSPEDEEGRRDDEVLHDVVLTRGFEIQATPVTQFQYLLVMGRNPSHFRTPRDCDPGDFKEIDGVDLCLNQPVESVSWAEAQAFIARLNAIQGEYVYRLPTEAEWEYADRNGMPEGFAYSFGVSLEEAELGRRAWFSRNSGGRTHVVASKAPNRWWSLYDMNGNVSQWVSDWYGAYSATAARDPLGPASGSRRVIRGGSWFTGADALRCARRGSLPPGTGSPSVGFRLVRQPVGGDAR